MARAVKGKQSGAAKARSGQDKVVTRECTIRLTARLHRVTRLKRAPRAVKEVRKFAQKEMKTEDVRIDPRLCKYLWHNGIRAVPRRVRVRLSRRRNKDEDSVHQYYTLVTHVPVTSFKGLTTDNVEETNDE
ncbi:hypothetical protein HAZT_HAZT003251 [Hyalella azteca]|uniref:Large ribosomal subunit protein eL31 n=1 Tax=Hyalella azteca TaxID=294128 RepID=A0A6A0H891_HYAAZ|nr:60S ribosomal protein L31 [Hyalella azteca]KAA0201973.1 hypothetical protein HAZT_HAZT003251 [Hyalella azteca]